MKGLTPMRDCFKMDKCRKYALPVIVLTLFIPFIAAVAIAQESQSISSTLRASKLASGTNTRHSRKPTLQELYAMFFTYAVHVDTVSDTDEKAGKDRKFLGCI